MSKKLLQPQGCCSLVVIIITSYLYNINIVGYLFITLPFQLTDAVIVTWIVQI